MSSPTFHNTIYLHGPHDPAVAWIERASGEPGFASISTSGASLLVSTVAEADALILAAVAAKDLLLAAQEPPLVMAPECARGDHHLCPGTRCECCLNGHPGAPLRDPGCICGRVDGSDYCPVHNNRIAVLPPGHGENHIDNAGHATLACGPCGLDTCVICGGRYEVDGSHVSALSGAHISAEPQQVST